jgi:hypothetical protein
MKQDSEDDLGDSGGVGEVAPTLTSPFSTEEEVLGAASRLSVCLSVGPRVPQTSHSSSLLLGSIQAPWQQLQPQAWPGMATCNLVPLVP